MFQKLLKLLHEQFCRWLTIILSVVSHFAKARKCEIETHPKKLRYCSVAPLELGSSPRGSSLGHPGYLMFDMRSVFHRAKTLSTIVTKQVRYQIFIFIFRLRVTSPRLGVRLWGTEGRLCLPCHIHSNTSSTCLLNKTNTCYLFSVFNLFFQTLCHQFYRKERVI